MGKTTYYLSQWVQTFSFLQNILVCEDSLSELSLLINELTKLQRQCCVRSVMVFFYHLRTYKICRGVQTVAEIIHHICKEDYTCPRIHNNQLNSLSFLGSSWDNVFNLFRSLLLYVGYLFQLNHCKEKI